MHDIDERPPDLGAERSAPPVVVTGAAGFIGSQLVEALLQGGRAVVAIDDLNPSYDTATKAANLALARSHPACRVAVADLGRARLDDLFAGASVVFHLAAKPGVQDSWGEGFGETCRRNIEVTQQVFEAALEAGVGRVVFASSSSVYGNGSSTGGDGPRPWAPISPYGVSKLAGEQLAAVYRERGLAVTILRYFTVYGPRQRPDMAMHRMFQAAAGLGPVFVRRGDGSQCREFTFVDDVVRATIAAGDAPGADHRTFDVGGGSSVSLNEVLDLVGTITGTPVPVVDVPLPAGDPPATEADVAATTAILGWEPQVPLAAGLAAQWAWHRRLAGCRG